MSKPRSHKALSKKLTIEEIKKLIAKFVRQLKRASTPEAERTLDIYKSMRTFEDGEPRTSPQQQLEILACQRWQQMRKCPDTGEKTREHTKVCRRRFLCLNCSDYKLKSQAERWTIAIRQVLRSRDTHIGPALCISWPIEKTKTALTQFDGFINKTLMSWLNADGITPEDIIICRTFDPIQGNARLVYLGPPTTTELFLKIYKPYIRNNSVVVPPISISNNSVVGHATDWKADTCRFTYLLNSIHKNWGEADTLDYYLRECLRWCVGDSKDLLRLDRNQVWRLYAQFSNTRLFSSRGMIYEATTDNRIAPLLNPQEHEPTMNIWKQYEDGSTDLLARHPAALLGTETGELPPMPGEDLCAKCGKSITDHERIAEPNEKDDGEEGESSSPSSDKCTVY
jgi:hypothetical protein